MLRRKVGEGKPEENWPTGVGLFVCVVVVSVCLFVCLFVFFFFFFPGLFVGVCFQGAPLRLAERGRGKPHFISGGPNPNSFACACKTGVAFCDSSAAQALRPYGRGMSW